MTNPNKFLVSTEVSKVDVYKKFNSIISCINGEVLRIDSDMNLEQIKDITVTLAERFPFLLDTNKLSPNDLRNSDIDTLQKQFLELCDTLWIEYKSEIRIDTKDKNKLGIEYLNEELLWKLKDLYASIYKLWEPRSPKEDKWWGSDKSTLESIFTFSNSYELLWNFEYLINQCIGALNYDLSSIEGYQSQVEWIVTNDTYENVKKIQDIYFSILDDLNAKKRTVYIMKENNTEIKEDIISRIQRVFKS